MTTFILGQALRAMPAKTLKIKISLGSANGAKQKNRTAIKKTNNEISYTGATPHSKSNQPLTLAVLLVVGVVGIMFWLFFVPSPKLQPTTALSAFTEDSTPATTKQTTVTLDNKIEIASPLLALPIIATPITDTLAIDENPLLVKSETALPAQAVTNVVARQVDPVATAKIKTNNNIRRAQFTNGIIKREPIDNVDELRASEKELKKLYYFTELQGLKGQTITHQWQHENNVVAEIEFKVRGNRWRVYSSKYLQSHKKGSWQVVVKDEKGNRLEVSPFTYQ